MVSGGWGDAASDPPVYQPPDDVVARDYPWLSEVNPYRGQGGRWDANCVWTAMATDLSLRDGRAHPVPPPHPIVVQYLRLYRDRPPVKAADYAAIVAAMAAAPLGSRGAVIASTDEDVPHVFNVVHARNGVVFLDGQAGRQARLSREVTRLRFVPVTDGIPEPVAPAEPR